MKEIDLSDFKAAWQEVSNFNTEVLSEADVRKYLASKSKSITASFRNGLIIDIILKTLLAGSFGLLLWLYLSNLKIITVCAILILVIVYLLYYLLSVIKQIPGHAEYSGSLYKLLENEIRFFKTRFSKVVYIIALSNPLFIFSGMLFYFQFKYSGFRELEAVDFIVLSLICIAGFILGAFVLLWQYNYQVKQLEECLTELDKDGLKALTAGKQKAQNRRLFVIFTIVLICGLLLFGYLLLI